MSDPFAEAAWMLRQRGAIEFADALDKEVTTFRATIKRLTKELEEALQRGVVLAIKSEKNEHRADSLAIELAEARAALREAQFALFHDSLDIKDRADQSIRAALSPKPEVVREVDRDEVDMEQLEHDA